MTICNMSIEGGARAGLIAPDETTFAYLKGRNYAPSGAEWDEALEYWRTWRPTKAPCSTRRCHRRRRPRTVRVVGHQPGADRRRHRIGAIAR